MGVDGVTTQQVLLPVTTGMLEVLLHLPSGVSIVGIDKNASNDERIYFRLHGLTPGHSAGILPTAHTLIATPIFRKQPDVVLERWEWS